MTSSSTPPLTATGEASQLRLGTFRLARRLRANRAIDSMSDAHFAVVAALHAHGPHTLRELAERERVSAPSMNRTVNCLEQSGYVTRTPDAEDRRKVNIAATAEGSRIVVETVRRRDAWLEDALAELDPAERALLLAAVPIMRKVAER